MNRGRRLALAKEISKIYVLDVANIEVGYVWIRDDDFVVRMVQRFREHDLDDEIRDVGVGAQANSDLVFTKVPKTDPYQMQCFKLFGANKDDITGILFDHFNNSKTGEFDDFFSREKYQVLYHNDYPKDEVSLDNKKDRDDIANIFVDQAADADGEDERQGVDLLGGHLLAMHRDKMDKAFHELRDAIRTFKEKHGSKGTSIPWYAINEWKCMLVEHEYKPAVIEDIMEIAKV